jgi:hypothetical protein
LKAFAAMVDEPEALVLQRLSLLPGLVPLAMAAGEVRMDRKHSGKVMAITGFSILGVGLVGGLALIASGISSGCSNEGCSGDDGRMQLGLGVAAVSAGVGLALGIPGIVRMSSQSSLEDDAVARYRAAGSSTVAGSRSTPFQSRARVATWPLISLSF